MTEVLSFAEMAASVSSRAMGTGTPHARLKLLQWSSASLSWPQSQVSTHILEELKDSGVSGAKYHCHEQPGSGMSSLPRPTSWLSLTHSSQGMYLPHALLTPSSALSLK